MAGPCRTLTGFPGPPAVPGTYPTRPDGRQPPARYAAPVRGEPITDPRLLEGSRPLGRSRVERLFTQPPLFVAMVLTLVTIGLLIDRGVDPASQLVLGAVVWAVLLVSLRYLSPIERARTSIVVIVATCAEIIGSVIWGVYTYRLGNLPMFVPPGHGLVYLTGLRITQLSWVRAHSRAFIGATLTFLVTWALLGLFVLERRDLAGALGAAVLVGFVLRGRAPLLYCGVFAVVAYLELYGTAVGTWTWAAEIPGTGIPDGNPPSGVAAGYVFFDIAALALAPWLLATARRLGRSPRMADA